MAKIDQHRVIKAPDNSYMTTWYGAATLMGMDTRNVVDREKLMAEHAATEMLWSGELWVFPEPTIFITRPRFEARRKEFDA